MKILAIETSCDETSVAIIENGNRILTNLVSSQIKTHSKYGGVVPEIASRMHAECIHYLIDQAMAAAKCSLKDLSAIAATYGPGLEGALLIGLSAAKTMASMLDIPLIPVHHIWGHIYANFLSSPAPTFPFVCLVVSGGHTQLLHVKDHFKCDILGQTRDDAAGEAFDKIARVLDLGYPGGPIIEKMATNGDTTAFAFPKAMLKQGYEFSFSGLKTAVIQKIRQLKADNVAFKVEDICASFQHTVIEILAYKAIKACGEFNCSQLILSGGVTANQALKSRFEIATKEKNIQLFIPSLKLCTDNAAMIGVAGYYQYQLSKTSHITIKVNPSAAVTD